MDNIEQPDDIFYRVVKKMSCSTKKALTTGLSLHGTSGPMGI